MPRYAPSHPWRAADRIDGLIPIRDQFGQDVLFVPADDSLTTERTIAAVEGLSDLTANYAGMADASIRAALHRISALDVLVCVASGVGIAAGFVGALS